MTLPPSTDRAVVTETWVERVHDCNLSTVAAYCCWAQVSLDEFLALPDPA